MKIAQLILPFVLLSPLLAQAQRGEAGSLPTQVLVRSDQKEAMVINPAMLSVEVENHMAPLTSLTPVRANDTQVALLIDDGLSRSSGIQLNDIKNFVRSLPPTTEILVGYMSNGRVLVTSPFTTDHQAAANSVRLPFGTPGQSASPYFCLTDFVKKWPGSGDAEEGQPRQRKARFVMMITNGVDPYNGSTSLFNQDSPYVKSAIEDAQRAGVAVSSIYYRDAGFGNGSAAVSGQSYLEDLAQSTGGKSYYEGFTSPVSLQPFLREFTADLSETFIATFPVEGGLGGRSQLAHLKIKSSQPRLKLRSPNEVRPGNKEMSAGNVEN